MKKFIIKLLVTCAPVLAVFAVSVFTPPTPRASKSLLMSSIRKTDLLEITPSPRIVFIGGSNLSFGLNSQMIRDALNMNPVNTAIHKKIGLKFMLDSTLAHIIQGDIVVLVPEYGLFYKSLDTSSVELARMVFDVDINNLRYLNLSQCFNTLKFLPEYAVSKLKLNEYLFYSDSDIYSVNSFNQYGDVDAHWGLANREFAQPSSISGHFNHRAVNHIKALQATLAGKGVRFFVSFPCMQATAFEDSASQISEVEHELRKAGLNILGSPGRYKMPDALFFNTVYHLNKQGVDIRTARIIQDIQTALYGAVPAKDASPPAVHHSITRSPAILFTCRNG